MLLKMQEKTGKPSSVALHRKKKKMRWEEREKKRRKENTMTMQFPWLSTRWRWATLGLSSKLVQVGWQLALQLLL